MSVNRYRSSKRRMSDEQVGERGRHGSANDRRRRCRGSSRSGDRASPCRCKRRRRVSAADYQRTSDHRNDKELLLRTHRRARSTGGLRQLDQPGFDRAHGHRSEPCIRELSKPETRPSGCLAVRAGGCVSVLLRPAPRDGRSGGRGRRWGTRSGRRHRARRCETSTRPGPVERLAPAGAPRAERDRTESLPRGRGRDRYRACRHSRGANSAPNRAPSSLGTSEQSSWSLDALVMMGR
jgi:hypothetical protein